MRIGMMEVLVILALILLLFGAKRLPELARALGRSLQEFKKGTKEVMDGLDSDKEQKSESKNAG